MVVCLFEGANYSSFARHFVCCQRSACGGLALWAYGELGNSACCGRFAHECERLRRGVCVEGGLRGGAGRSRRRVRRTVCCRLGWLCPGSGRQVPRRRGTAAAPRRRARRLCTGRDRAVDGRTHTAQQEHPARAAARPPARQPLAPESSGTTRAGRSVVAVMNERGSLGVLRGSALYVGALIGPGVLLVPALAAQAAGAASIIAWGGLLVLSAPLAITFAALGVRHPVAGGVSTYVREGFGDGAAAVTGAWVLCAVLLGGAAVSLIRGVFVADLTGSGTVVATLVGLAMFGTVIVANMLGLRVSSGFQLGLASVLVVVMAIAITVALPSRGGHNWTPFAPHGWWAVGTAANILIWLFLGWEAVAQLVGDFRRPEVDLPRAMALAFGLVTVLYAGLAVATIGVTGGTHSRVPLPDIVSVGFGRVGP